MIVLQIGQCGNQLGTALFHHLFQQLTAPSPEKRPESAQQRRKRPRDYSARRERCFYTTKDQWYARAILLDTETKVISAACASATAQTDATRWHYDPKCIVSLRKGAGNCWATGRFEMGERMLPAMMRAIRYQIQMLPLPFLNDDEDAAENTFDVPEDHKRPEAFLLLHSLAGGTGSGLGSFATDMLHKYFPNVPIVNLAVLPHATGEVVVQSLNVCLSLYALQQASSAIFLFSNDQIHESLERKKGGGSTSRELPKKRQLAYQSDLLDINDAMMLQFCELILPSKFTIDLLSGKTFVGPADITITDILDLLSPPQEESRQNLFTLYRKTALSSSSVASPPGSSASSSSTLPPNATMADVKAVMDHLVICSDRPNALREKDVVALAQSASSLPAFVRGQLTGRTSGAKGNKVLRERLKVIALQAIKLMEEHAFLHHFTKHGATESLLLDAVFSLVHVLKR